MLPISRTPLAMHAINFSESPPKERKDEQPVRESHQMMKTTYANNLEKSYQENRYV